MHTAIDYRKYNSNMLCLPSIWQAWMVFKCAFISSSLAWILSSRSCIVYYQQNKPFTTNDNTSWTGGDTDKAGPYFTWQLYTISFSMEISLENSTFEGSN